jgi:trigger factor
VINLTMKEGGVVLEGGEGRDHGIYTGEGHYIEGMIDKIIGMKEGETKEFQLPFPKDHYQKHLAGKKVDFEVKMNEIFELEAPKIDDEFAKKVGLKTKKELEEKIAENIQAENEQSEARRLEKEMFDAVIKKCTFDEIPELLVNQELQKMVQELAQNVKDQGMELETYLKQIGKSLDDIKLDFTTTAMERIKASMILKHIMDEQKIKVSEKEVDAQLDEIAEHYKDNEEAKKNIYMPQYREYLETQMKHQKALEWLRDQVIK